jgi:hypothetical protein
MTLNAIITAGIGPNIVTGSNPCPDEAVKINIAPKLPPLAQNNSREKFSNDKIHLFCFPVPSLNCPRVCVSAITNHA